jgi:hypothetical protein
MSEFLIRNVRVRFNHLFTPMRNKETGKPQNYNGLFMLDPNAADVQKLEQYVNEVPSKDLGVDRLPSDKYCLRSGEDRVKPEMYGTLGLSANRHVDDGRPIVLFGNATACDQAENNPIYDGCYANIKVRIWSQDNKHGKRVNAELLAVQFAGDGEPLSAAHVDKDKVAAEFGAVPGATDTAANAAPAQQPPAAAINQFG